MSASSTGDERAMTILRELHAAEKELVGKAVVLTDGKAGTIDQLFLDDEHGLRIAISSICSACSANCRHCWAISR